MRTAQWIPLSQGVNEFEGRRKKPQKAQEAHKFLVPFVLFVVPVPLRCEFVHGVTLRVSDHPVCATSDRILFLAGGATPPSQGGEYRSHIARTETSISLLSQQGNALFCQ